MRDIREIKKLNYNYMPGKEGIEKEKQLKLNLRGRVRGRPYYL